MKVTGDYSIFIDSIVEQLPLSAAPFRPRFGLQQLLTAFTPYKFVANLLAMILFGLIVAFSVRNVPDAAKTHRRVIARSSGGNGT